MKMSKIRKKCINCGSTHISKDAWVYWDEDKQEWMINDIFDDIYCFDCQTTSKEYKEEEIND